MLSTIDFKAFDTGVVTTLGATLIDMVIDNTTRQVYAVKVNGITTNIEGYKGLVPVSLAHPQDVFRPYKLPCFVFRAGDPASAFERGAWFGWERQPSEGAKQFGVMMPDGSVVYGYESYDVQAKPIPFNLPYDLIVMGRSKGESLALLKHVLGIWQPPYSSVEAFGSAGDRRLYDAGPITISSSNDITSVMDRTISWNVSFEVQGEIDIIPLGVESIFNEDADSCILIHYPNVDLKGYSGSLPPVDKRKHR